MKNSKIKIVAFIILILMLLSILTVPVKAETYEKVVLKKADNEFLIYYKDICNDEFEFAFSLDSNKPADELFTKSAKDQATEGALNVVYVDETLYNTYFTTNKAYVWIRDNSDKVVVSADLVDLTDALDNEMIEVVNTTTIVDAKTDRIEVDTTQIYETHPEVEDVTTTVTRGKIVVKEKENSKYYYSLVKVSDEGSKAKEMYDLAKTLSDNKTTDTYKSLSLTKKFYELYEELTPTDNEWEEVVNSEILQPDTARTGDKYIVYIKEANADGEIIDAKFLESVYKFDEVRKDEEDTVVTETVNLPVTFDSGSILFIILGIIVLALVIFVIIRIRANKKDESK